MIMTVAIWGGGTTDDLAERIRTGDVAIDLYRPVSLLGWYLAGDLGRAAYHLLTRGVAPTVVGALLFDLRFPAARWPASRSWSSVALARRGELRDPDAGRARSAFWLLDQSGLLTLSAVLRDVLLAGWSCRWCCSPSRSAASRWRCPGRRSSRCPIDIWLGKRHGAGRARRPGVPGRLGRGAAARRAPACSGSPTRKVVVQGG